MSPFIIPLALAMFLLFLGPVLVWFGVMAMGGYESEKANPEWKRGF